jgi:3-oxoacyl-[acyl-carrier protein] reductase
MITAAPSAISEAAIAFPMPDVDPVTSAVFLINGRREEKVNETIRELEKQTPDARLYPAAFDLGRLPDA